MRRVRTPRVVLRFADGGEMRRGIAPKRFPAIGVLYVPS
jgi:hypothetical protein